jgi:dTMP kinase
MQGRFITLEGLDGAGKSTHLPWLCEHLSQHAVVRVTREPGGTPAGERLRELMLDASGRLHPETETLLMFAARREHLAEVVCPSLAAGTWVLCDRFTDATFAYQGWGSGVDLKKIELLEQWVQQGLQPDLTLYFDLSPDQARARIAGTRALDRFEQEQRAFFERVRAGYLDRAQAYPHRFRVIDASQPVETIRTELARLVAQL